MGGFLDTCPETDILDQRGADHALAERLTGETELSTGHGTAAPPAQGHPSDVREHAAARWRRAFDLALSFYQGSTDEAVKSQEGKRILSFIEKQMIQRAVADTGGNQARAAQILGITRNTLKKRLDEYASN